MLNTQTLVEELYGDSRWAEASAPAAAELAGTVASRIPLSGAARDWTLSRALRSRAATYAYADDPVPAALLHAVLGAGPRESEPGVDFHLFAWRVEGIDPGTYRYDARGGELQRTGAAPDPVRDGSGLLLQKEFAGAAVLVFAVCDLASAVALEGGVGHRRILVRSGAALHRAWLSAAGRGLAGCIFAAFYRRAVSSFLGVDGLTRAATAALALGYPAREEP